jgi:hypothetical protein
MKQKQLPKPRNPFVQHLIVKKQGAHTKSYKTHRRDAKVALKKSSDYSTKHDDVLLSSLDTRIFCIPVPEWSMGAAF